MHLTDLTLKKLALPKGSKTSQHTFFDDSYKGFGVRVSVGGTKTFVLIHGKKRTRVTLGRYPEIGLAEARALARKALGNAQDAPTKRASTISFMDAREQFLEDARLKTKSSTFIEYQRLLTKHFNFTGYLSAVSRQDIMDVIDELKASPSSAQHAFVAIRTLMNWAVRRGYVAMSPMPALRFKNTSRSRILTDTELQSVWRRAQELGHPYGTIVQLLILTGQRRGEIAGLRRSWVTDDAITFPVGFCKNKREHKIPIGRRTKEILDGIPGTADLYFPARGKPELPFNGWSKSKAHFDETLSFNDYTLHDLRRTYSSNLAKLGVPIHVTEKLLNHVSGTLGGIAGVYNRHGYWEEMVIAVQKGLFQIRSELC
jgi:integrase